MLFKTNKVTIGPKSHRWRAGQGEPQASNGGLLPISSFFGTQQPRATNGGPGTVRAASRAHFSLLKATAGGPAKAGLKPSMAGLCLYPLGRPRRATSHEWRASACILGATQHTRRPQFPSRLPMAGERPHPSHGGGRSVSTTHPILGQVSLQWSASHDTAMSLLHAYIIGTGAGCRDALSSY